MIVAFMRTKAVDCVRSFGQLKGHSEPTIGQISLLKAIVGAQKPSWMPKIPLWGSKSSESPKDHFWVL